MNIIYSKIWETLNSVQSAKDLIADSDKERAQLEDQIKKLVEELNNYRNKLHEAERGADVTRKELDNVLGRLGALEAEIELLKRRISLMEESIGHLKRENHRMIDSLHHARNVSFSRKLNLYVQLSGCGTRNSEPHRLSKSSADTTGGVWFHSQNSWFGMKNN